MAKFSETIYDFFLSKCIFLVTTIGKRLVYHGYKRFLYKPCFFLDLVISVRVANSSDPDFIEVEIPRWKLTYTNLMKICCEELEIVESQVERIRKLPNTRLRKDSDVKRLINFQSLEMVLKSSANGDKSSNCYQSISTCKDQTILY